MKKIKKSWFLKSYLSLSAITWLLIIPLILIFCLGLPKWIGRVISVFSFFGGIFVISFIFSTIPGTDYDDPEDIKKHSLTHWQNFFRRYFYIIPWKQDEKKKSLSRIRTIFLGGGRVVALILGILWLRFLFVPFSRDLVLLIERKPCLEQIQGKVIEHDSVYGMVPLYQTFQLENVKDPDGSYKDFYYYYGFTFLKIGSIYNFKVLKNSSIVVDSKKIERLGLDCTPLVRKRCPT